VQCVVYVNKNEYDCSAGLGAWELTGTTTLTAAFTKEKEPSDIARDVF
jgi:hypothetical protein